MNLRVPSKAQVDEEADIDGFLSENRDYVAAKLEAAREEIARGEVSALEPLEDLLAEARRQTIR